MGALLLESTSSLSIEEIKPAFSEVAKEPFKEFVCTYHTIRPGIPVKFEIVESRTSLAVRNI